MLLYRCVLAGVFGEIALRTELEMMTIRGFAHFQLDHFMSKIFWPLAGPLADLVFVPFFLSRFAGMFIESYLMRTLLVRVSMHIYLLVRLTVFLSTAAFNYLITLHNEIRDSRFLIGVELSNRVIPPPPPQQQQQA
jgi:hypothetical protein